MARAIFKVGDRVKILETDKSYKMWHNLIGTISCFSEISIYVTFDTKQGLSIISKYIGDTQEYPFGYDEIELIDEVILLTEKDKESEMSNCVSSAQFKVDCLTGEMCAVLQQKAFDCGITYPGIGKHIGSDKGCRYLYVNASCWEGLAHTTDCLSGKRYFDEENIKQVSIGEFIQKLEDMKEKDSEIFEVEGYDSIISADGTLKVGCTTFRKEDVEKFIKMYENPTHMNVKDPVTNDIVEISWFGDRSVSINEENDINAEDICELIAKYKKFMKM